MTLKLAAASFSVTVKTAAKVRRFREGGCTVCRTVARVLVGCAAQRLSPRSTRWWLAPTALAGSRIAGHTGLATVSRILRHLKLNHIRHLRA